MVTVAEAAVALAEQAESPMPGVVARGEREVEAEEQPVKQTDSPMLEGAKAEEMKAKAGEPLVEQVE